MTAPAAAPGIAFNPDIQRPGTNRPTFRRRHLLPALIVYVVATGVFLTAVLALLRAEALDTGAALNRSFAQVVEEQTARTVASVEDLLRLAQDEVVSRLEAGSAAEPVMRVAFRKLLDGRTYVRAIWYVDRDGRSLFDSDEGSVGLDLFDRPYFAPYRQSPAPGFRLNAPIRSRTTGNWFIPATSPVYDGAGGLLGVVVASLEPDYLGRVWSNQEPGDDLSVFFMRRDGTLLLRSPLMVEAMGKSFARHELFQQHLPASPVGSFAGQSLVDTQARLFAYRVLARYQDLVVVVTRTVDHVLAGWWRFFWLSLSGWVASSAALGWFALLLIRESERRLSVESNLQHLATERAAIIDALPAHIALLDERGTIAAVNRAWQSFGQSEMLGDERGGVGASYLETCDSATGDRSGEAAAAAAGIRAVLQGSADGYALEYPCHSPTEQRWFRLIVAPLADRRAPGAVLMHLDITDRKQNEQLHEAETQILEMISTGAGLPAVLEKIAIVIEELAPSTTASVVLLDPATKRLRHGAAPNLPAAYTTALEGLPIGPQAGSCGTAMFRGEQVVVSDIERDPLWDGYRDLVRPYGFRSCWSTPIVDADDKALASVALYFRDPRTPSEADQRLIYWAVHLVRIAIENSQKDEELRASAHSLRESEQRFQALASATFDAIWDRDIKANTVWWSEGFKTVFGFTQEEVAQRPLSWRARIHPDDLERILGGMEDAMRRKATDWRDEYRLFHKSGRTLYIADRARFIYGPDGEPSRLVGGMSDVTSMHEAKERIEQLQSSLETLIGAAKIGILVHQDFNPVLVNAELARMLGYASPEEILAMGDCRALFAPEEIERISAYNTSRKRGGAAPGFYAVKGCRKDGTLIEMENRAFSIAWEGRVSVCAMLVDVTDRLALEEQLRQSQRLEAVGQLTGGIAHDFNNLLQVILGNAEHLASSLAENDDLRPMVEMTRLAAERGATLTNRLLAFSRRQTLAPKATDIGATIGGMSALLRRTLGEQVTIDVIDHPGLWQAFIDAPQLENAVLNLCLNARDAMPNGGRLTVELCNVSLDRAYAEHAGDVEPGDYVLVAISDTGEGMSAEVLARVFEPFFTTKEVGKGSGLGLSMVLGFIKQSKGHVKIYSEPGQGTTVKLYLPRAVSAEAEHAEHLEEEPTPGGTERVLLVEDDDLVRAHATALLTSLGYDVVAAAHGNEALDRLRAGPRFDLLFTDVVMPGGINGRQLAEVARSIQPDLPVLFTSGYTDMAVMRHGHLDADAQVVPKPYRRQDLARKLRETLDQRT